MTHFTSSNSPKFHKITWGGGARFLWLPFLLFSCLPNLEAQSSQSLQEVSQTDGIGFSQVNVNYTSGSFSGSPTAPNPQPVLVNTKMICQNIYPDGKAINLIQLKFTNTNLGQKSYVILRGTTDNATQKLTSLDLNRWQNLSALFNGACVEAKLYIDKSDTNVQWNINLINVSPVLNNYYGGLPFVEFEPQSTTLDEYARQPTQHNAVVRLFRVIAGEDKRILPCTGFLLSNGLIATAGHCARDWDKFYNTLIHDKVIVEFNAPSSTSDGEIRLSPPCKQHMATLLYGHYNPNAHSIYTDWAFYRLLPNGCSNTQAEFPNSYFGVNTTFNPNPSNTSTGYFLGYGSDMYPRGTGWNPSPLAHSKGYLPEYIQTDPLKSPEQKQALIRFYNSANYALQKSNSSSLGLIYESLSNDKILAITQTSGSGGSSGSPILKEGKNEVLGITTFGSGLFSPHQEAGKHFYGPSFNNPTLKTKLIELSNGLWLNPNQAIDPSFQSGTYLNPYTNFSTAFTATPNNGILKVVGGDYSAENITLNKSLTIEAPTGYAYLGDIQVANGANINLILKGRVVLKNINVPIGSTLSISSVSDTYNEGRIFVAPNAKIEARGTLNIHNTELTSPLYLADGTSNNNTWKGITFFSNSNGAISNTTLSKVSTGAGNGALAIYDASPTIENSKISNANSGFGFSVLVSGAGAFPQFISNRFENYDGGGVYVTQGASPSLLDNTFINNGANANQSGIYATSGAFVLLGQDGTAALNRFYGSGTGIWAWGATVYAGLSNFNYAHNYFCNSGTHIKAQNGANVYARYSYWETLTPIPSSTPVVWHENSMPVQYQPSLGNCSTPPPLWKQEFAKDDDATNDTLGTILKHIRKKQYTEAFNLVEISAQNVGNLSDLIPLYSQIYLKGGFPNALDALNRLAMTKEEAKIALMRLYLKENDTDKVYVLAESLKGNNSNNAQLAAAYAYLRLGETNKAQVILNKLKEMSSDDRTQALVMRWLGGEFNEADYKQSINQPHEQPKDKVVSVYPNPFNETATIQYTLEQESHVSLKIFDVLGREAGILANELQGAGVYNAPFNAENLPNGLYMYQLWINNKVHTGHVMLIK